MEVLHQSWRQSLPNAFASQGLSERTAPEDLRETLHANPERMGHHSSVHGGRDTQQEQRNSSGEKVPGAKRKEWFVAKNHVLSGGVALPQV